MTNEILGIESDDMDLAGRYWSAQNYLNLALTALPAPASPAEDFTLWIIEDQLGQMIAEFQKRYHLENEKRDRVAKYQKKPVTIEAIQWTGNNTNVVMDFCPAATCRDMKLLIPTLEGEMQASPGDFIIKGVLGEYYPCKPSAFKQTYDELKD